MRKLPRLSLLLLGTALLVTFASAEKPATLPTPTGYIDDYAAVLSPTAKEQMEALCGELHDKSRAQVFVVTVNTLDGEAIEPFANELFHRWKIGEKKTDRGVLLLFAIKDHRYRIEVGYGLEGILNDAKVGDIGRALVPDLKAGNYDQAIGLGLRSVVQIVADDAKVQLDALNAAANAPAQPLATEQAAPPSAAPPTSDSSDNGWILNAVIIGFFGLMLLLVIILIWRKGTWTSGSSSTSFGSDDSSSSSSSSDSSSDSFSGGDGGDSGGGGASGSW